MKVFILTVLGVVSTRILDLFTTYKITPDLEKESNLFVKLLGETGGWAAIWIFQAIVVILLLYLEYLRIKSPTVEYVEDEGLKFKEYFSLNYSSKKDDLIKSVMNLPLKKRLMIDLLGYIGTRTLLFGTIPVCLSSLFAILNSSYRSFYVDNSLWRILYLIMAVVLVSFYIRFFWIRFKDYEKKDILKKM